ncbi:MAG: peptidoglycan editing factor PgeF [Geminicoccaceae bacterium]
MIDVVRATGLEVEGLVHGFAGRRGGVSEGIFASLNVGARRDDSPEAVATNRERIARAHGFALDDLKLVRQVHGARAVEVSAAAADVEADGLVADRPDVLLGITTADCAPVLLADASAGVIGAAHAGWRGALAGILEATLELMISRGASPERVLAAIGPCIQQNSYEVDAPVRDAFLRADRSFDPFFAANRPGHWQFDLTGLCQAKLARLGVAQVETTGHDTYGDAERWFSCRRATHRSEPGYGLQLSVIGRPAES